MARSLGARPLASTIASRRRLDHAAGKETRMGAAADFTALVLLVALGVGLWSVFDRLGQLQRDVDALKRKLGVTDPPDVG
jgi:hypothetical protein